MIETQPTPQEPVRRERDVLHEQHRAQSSIDHVLERLSPLDLPAKEQFERYLRHKARLNHKPSTLDNSFTPRQGVTHRIAD
jgi:hypothetical protein